MKIIVVISLPPSIKYIRMNKKVLEKAVTIVRIVLKPLAYIILTSHQNRLSAAPHPPVIRFVYINRYRMATGMMAATPNHRWLKLSVFNNVMDIKHMVSNVMMEKVVFNKSLAVNVGLFSLHCEPQIVNGN